MTTYLAWAWTSYSEGDPRGALVYHGRSLNAARKAVIDRQDVQWFGPTPEHSYRRGDRPTATTSSIFAVGSVPALDPDEIIVVPATPGELSVYTEGAIERSDGKTSELELVDSHLPEPVWRWTEWE